MAGLMLILRALLVTMMLMSVALLMVLIMTPCALAKQLSLGGNLDECWKQRRYKGRQIARERVLGANTVRFGKAALARRLCL